MAEINNLPDILPVGLSTNGIEYEMNRTAAKYNATSSPEYRGSLFAKYKKLGAQNLWE